MLRPAFGPPQGEPEGATRAEFRLHADGAAVQLDQAFREREAEARPFVAAALTRVELRSEEHTSELQSQSNLVCRLLLEKKKKNKMSSPCYIRAATQVTQTST